MDFTLPLYPEQNREGRQGGKGWGGGCKGDLWPSNLHFEQGHCFSPTCRMSKCLFFFFFFFSKELHGFTVSDSFLLSHSPTLPADINNPCMPGLKPPQRPHCQWELSPSATHSPMKTSRHSRNHMYTCTANQSLDSGDTPVRCFPVLYYSLTSSLWDNQIIDRMDDLSDICKLRLTCCVLLWRS